MEAGCFIDEFGIEVLAFCKLFAQKVSPILTLGVNLFQRERKGVALTAAGKAFLIDARGILEACDLAVRKAQRINRGELTVGYMAALTHDFLGQTLERWQKISPGVVVDCVEMDPETQERAPLDGRIAVGILVLLSNRPFLELLRVQLLIQHPVAVALPKSPAILARGGKAAVFDGRAPQRVVVIEFPTLADAKRWRSSPAFFAPY